MNRKEAEDLVYRSYMKAKEYQDYEAKDREKRHPQLTKEWILSQVKEDKSWAPGGVRRILVTGSKGKGSTANMIACILRSRGPVGLMTSPHLISFCERFRVDDRMISDEEFTGQMGILKPRLDEIEKNIPPWVCISPMGVQAVLALSWFAEKKAPIQVFECGKGVRYDDVGNIPHDIGVINTIFLEHTRELGDTLEEIAKDKSHLITGREKIVFVGEQRPEVLEVIRERAKEKGVPLKIYGEDFYAENIRYQRSGMVFDVVAGEKRAENLMIPLLGAHQARNGALALAAAWETEENLSVSQVRETLSHLDWPGRMEVVSREPLILLDACIHRDSCSGIKEVLRELGLDQVTCIIGIPQDKDYLGVAEEMRDWTDRILLTKSQNPHYHFSERQREVLQAAGIPAEWTESFTQALEEGKKMGKPILILGTTSLVAEVKRQWKAEGITA